ncbi:hypothetical protein EUTSA_v10009302mg, partial [Eutrema salsugineum]
MVSTTIKSDSKHEEKQTLNSKNPKNVYQIGGLQVEFPYQPYGTQLAFMSRVISTLERAQRDGHCHALLESPTGTGKSLSLLCSVLAWQQNYKKRFPKGNLSRRNHGGESETQPSDTPFPSNEKPDDEPCSSYHILCFVSIINLRTHAQIAQVIREYRKTGYRVPMAVLGSRKRYCTNPHVQGKENVDEKCRLLLKDKKNKNIKCPEYRGVVAVLASLQQKSHDGVHDIEDLVKIGNDVRGRLLNNFTVNSNMEDIAREAGSINLEEGTLFKLRNELEQMSVDDPETCQPLCDLVEGLISWIRRRKDSLAKRDSEHFFSRGYILLAFSYFDCDNSIKLIAIYHVIAITKLDETEIEPDMPYLSGISVSTLKELFTTFTYFFSRNGSHIIDYELGLQRSIKRGTSEFCFLYSRMCQSFTVFIVALSWDAGDPSSGKWTHTFSLWCMNPSAVFKDLADLSLSIILTSGTLSPMNSFSSELGMQFGTCLEATHVIDANLQVWAGALSKGPGSFPLNASYKTADTYSFQDTLGKSLEEICTIVPDGSLIFFPSYKLMEKLSTRWRETGQWSRLCLRKELFIEPRGEAKDDFDSVLKGYYDCLSGKNRLVGRNGIVNKSGTVITEDQDDSKKGAAFLAVCREKVSEGLDFSDDNARAVIIVGIPFPNLHDVLVELKRKYNDTYKSSKNLLGGSEWYCQQAYRALNQAAGRCIRHRFDYGAIIFLVMISLRSPCFDVPDERYRQPRNRVSISKWLRQSIKLYDNFEESMQGLRSFFNSVKERVDSKMLESQENQIKECKRKENQVQNKFSHVEPNEMARRKVVNLEDYTSPNPKYYFMNESKPLLDHKDRKSKIAEGSRSMRLSGVNYGTSTPQLSSPFIQVKEEDKCYKEVIDLECSVKTEPGYCEGSSVTNCDEDPETSSVKKTFGMIKGTSAASPCSCSKNESSNPARGLRSLRSPDKRSPLGSESSVIVTPERYSIGYSRNSTLEAESPLNKSVNSHALKRRKFTSPQVIDLEEEEDSNAPSTSFTRRIEFGFESSESRSQNDNVYAFPEVDQRVMRISCSLCRSPLGHPESHSYLSCSLTSLSKTYLLSLLTSGTGSALIPTSVSVVMTYCSLVNQRLCRSSQGSKGIWCEQDGCVFNTIFCPFCSVPNTCLGVQVMATDSSNVQFLRKILFFADQVDVTEDASSKETAPEQN